MLSKAKQFPFIYWYEYRIHCMKKMLIKKINRLLVILKPDRSYNPDRNKYTSRTRQHYACVIAIAVGLMLGCTNQDNISQALYIKGDLVLDYQPESNLVQKQSIPGKPKYPVIDVHTHFSSDLTPTFLLEKWMHWGLKLSSI